MPHSSIRGAVRKVGAIVVAAGLAVTVAACSPDAPQSPTEAQPPAPTETPEPVRAVDIAAGQQDGPVDVEVDGGAEGVGVTFRELTIEPGAGTGEHCHYGQLIAVVEQGELTHYADIYPGGVHIYRQGESIIEGAGYPHEGRNEGDQDVVLMVTYVIPEGKPLAETDLANCDH